MIVAQASFMVVGRVPAKTMEVGDPVKGLKPVSISGVISLIYYFCINDLFGPQTFRCLVAGASISRGYDRKSYTSRR
jgi:hypothetical protein